MYLTQHVTEATRKDNIFDLVLTSQPNLVENVSIVESFSDYNIVLFYVIVVVNANSSNVNNIKNKKGVIIVK